MSLEIIPVWKNITPELEAELVDFWIGNKAIGDEKLAAERAKQVVCLVRSEKGEIVGVSTVQARIVPRLRQPMYYYRNFIVADYRGKQLAAPFLKKTQDVLQEYNLALPKPNCLGIIIELENTVPGGAPERGPVERGLHLHRLFPEGAAFAGLVLRRRQTVLRRRR